MVSNAKLNQLIIESQNSNEKAFEELYSLTYQILYSQVMKILLDKNYADDIVQETYLKVLSSKMKESNNCLAYLITIARNETTNFLKKRNKEIQLDEKTCDEYLNQNDDSDDFVDLYNAINSLSDYEKNILKFHLFDGMKFREISDKLKKPQGTILYQYNVIIKKLKGILTK